MKRKEIPSWISNRLVIKILQSRLMTYLSYWVFQGMLYMDTRETLIKLFIDAVLFLILYLSLNIPAIISLILAHTCNMFFNGHFFAMRRHLGLGSNSSEQFVNYIETFQKRIKQNKRIMGAAAYGSLSKNIYRPTSDIDIRFVPYPGNFHFISVCLFALSERMRAFFNRFPLDLYVFDNTTIDNKMSRDENPIIFHDPECLLFNKYDERVDIDCFLRRFRARYV